MQVDLAARTARDDLLRKVVAQAGVAQLLDCIRDLIAVEPSKCPAVRFIVLRSREMNIERHMYLECGHVILSRQDAMPPYSKNRQRRHSMNVTKDLNPAFRND